MSADEVRFAGFVLDFGRRELRRGGRVTNLQNIPFQLLTLLVLKQGQLLTREEIVEAIWGKDRFVDAEHGINTAVRKLRQALGEDPDHPRFIQTVVGKGYRFIAPIEVLGEAAGQQETKPPSRKWNSGWRAVRAWVIAAACLMALAATIRLLPHRHFVRPVGEGNGAEIRSLAVLPIRDLSSDPGEGYFADGMTNLLICDLAEAPGLRVTSYSSAMRYQNTNEPLREIAYELDVDAIVEGVMERAGHRIRITVQLVRVAPESQLWTESYEETMGNSVRIQDRVAQSIARRIWSKIDPTRRAFAVKTIRVVPESYLDYLKGRSHQKDPTAKGKKLAVDDFRQALRLDPRNAFAYVGMAEAYATKGGTFVNKDTLADTRKAALRAIALNDRLSEAHTALGMIEWFEEWRWKDGAADLRRAVELNPNSAVAHDLYSDVLLAEGRTADGLAEAAKYVQLDPVSPSARLNMAVADILGRRYGRAVIEARQAVSLDPNYVAARNVVGWANELCGMHSQALRELRLAVAQGGGDASKAYLARTCFESGNRVGGEKLLQEITRSGKAPYETAEVYAGLGQYSEAFEWLAKAVSAHDRDVPAYIRLDPWFNSTIRSDPRFVQILEQVGLP
ncbi:MAG: winged helix-turn-helix domain-containing protein [Acidobacteria bacterium]|nr:winged helix-turn-helix domain-containing protein [Acidobacteriota bacterium]